MQQDLLTSAWASNWWTCFVEPPNFPFIHLASNWWTCFVLESSHGTQISIYVHGVHDLSNEFQRGPNSIVLAPRWVLFRIAEAPYQKRSTSKKVVVFSGGACLCMGGLSKKGKCILSATSVQMTSNHMLVNHRCCTFGYFWILSNEDERRVNTKASRDGKVTQYERPLTKFTSALGTGSNDKEGRLAWSTFNRFV